MVRVLDVRPGGGSPLAGRERFSFVLVRPRKGDQIPDFSHHIHTPFGSPRNQKFRLKYV